MGNGLMFFHLCVFTFSSPSWDIGEREYKRPVRKFCVSVFIKEVRMLSGIWHHTQSILVQLSQFFSGPSGKERYRF